MGEPAGGIGAAEEGEHRPQARAGGIAGDEKQRPVEPRRQIRRQRDRAHRLAAMTSALAPTMAAAPVAGSPRPSAAWKATWVPRPAAFSIAMTGASKSTPSSRQRVTRPV